MVADKEIWKVHSRILSKGFNKKVLESSVKEINDEAEKLVEKLKTKVGVEIDFWYEIVEPVLETIMKNFLDLNWSDQNRRDYFKDSKR